MRYLLAAFLLLGLARADTFTFGKYPIAKGSSGPRVVEVLWADGSPRPVAGITGTLVVYSRAPNQGGGGSVLFIQPLNPAGDPNPANELVMYVTTTDTARPGSYYSEVVLVEADAVDVIHGTVSIEGR